jgi:hypothetical protein
LTPHISGIEQFIPHFSFPSLPCTGLLHLQRGICRDGGERSSREAHLAAGMVILVRQRTGRSADGADAQIGAFDGDGSAERAWMGIGGSDQRIDAPLLTGRWRSIGGAVLQSKP